MSSERDDSIDLAHIDQQFRRLEIEQSPADDQSPGDVIAARADGTITLDDGVTTHSYQRACEFLDSVRYAQADSLARMRASLAQIMNTDGGMDGGAEAKAIARAALEKEP